MAYPCSEEVLDDNVQEDSFQGNYTDTIPSFRAPTVVSNLAHIVDSSTR